jgi:hypothetical protein
VNPFTALLDVLGSALKFGKPILDRHLATSNEKREKEDIGEWTEVLATSEDKRADRIHSFVTGLLIDCGETPGGLGENVSVPVGYLSALVEVAIKKKRQDREIALATYAIQQAKS